MLRHLEGHIAGGQTVMSIRGRSCKRKMTRGAFIPIFVNSDGRIVNDLTAAMNLDLNRLNAIFVVFRRYKSDADLTQCHGTHGLNLVLR